MFRSLPLLCECVDVVRTAGNLHKRPYFETACRRIELGILVYEGYEVRSLTLGHDAYSCTECSGVQRLLDALGQLL